MKLSAIDEERNGRPLTALTKDYVLTGIQFSSPKDALSAVLSTASAKQTASADWVKCSENWFKLSIRSKV